jgi:hypothetical protein
VSSASTAELGHLLEFGLIMCAGVLEEVGVDAVHFLHGLARRQLLRREVFLGATLRKATPLLFKAAMPSYLAVHLRHRLERWPVYLEERLEAEWHHHGR